MRFAAFIMTYERPAIIPDTIDKLLDQTLPPEKILVVDNSASNDTERLLKRSSDGRVEYFRVGYNSGPAGAAKIALKRLTDEGFDWIYWGDDNNPPSGNGVFNALLAIGKSLPGAGAVGSLGGYLNRYTARTRNLMNKELGKVCEVDFIPGGKNFLINAQVVKKGVLPSEELFFGFEELDYCMKMKKAGFKLYVDGEAWLQSRIKAGNADENYKWKGRSFGSRVTVRHYYSARNMLYVLSRNRLYVAVAFTFAKTLGKSIMAFRFGLKPGWTAFKVYNTALLHFLLSKMGKQSINIES